MIELLTQFLFEWRWTRRILFGLVFIALIAGGVDGTTGQGVVVVLLVAIAALASELAGRKQT